MGNGVEHHRVDHIPEGTASVNQFINSPKGFNLIQRLAYLFWQLRGGGISTEAQKQQDIQNGAMVAEIGLLRQLARKKGIKLS